VVVALSACGSGGDADGDSGAAADVNKTWTSVDEMVAAAKKESGPLNVYIAPEYAPFVQPGFEKAYPWAKLNVTQLEPVPSVAKWSAELSSGFSQADVVFMHSTGVQTFKDLKALAQVTVPNDANVEPALQDKDHYSHPVTELGEVMLYNTKLISTPPKTVAELADPEWKGKVIMDSPQLGGAGGFVLASERSAMGDAAWQTWLQKVADNDLYVTDTSSASYAAVVRGDRPVCICNYGDYISQAPGTPVGVDFYGQDDRGIVVEPIVGTISKTAPHPALAALFMNWMLAADGGQQGFVDSGRVPTVPVPGADKVSLPEGTKVMNLYEDLGDYISDPDSANTVFKKIFK